MWKDKREPNKGEDVSWYGGHAIEERARAMFLEDMDHRDGAIVYYTAYLRELYETLAEAAGPYNRALANAAEATYELRSMLDTGEA